MAGVNFEKLKTSQKVKAVMRHCDKDERLKSQHSNKEIDKTLTSKNEQLGRNYAETCRKYDEIIRKLDSVEGANKRKDRVTCMALEVPFPENISETAKSDWRKRVYEIVGNQYGFENVLQVYDHRDEKHEYLDSETGEKRMSRDHLHILVVPEHDGKLNGKWFSSRLNMVKLNKSINEMSQKEFQVDFMNGTKRKSKDSVESLKNKSERLQILQSAKQQAEEIIRDAEEKARVLHHDALADRNRAENERIAILKDARKENEDLKAENERLKAENKALMEKNDNLYLKTKKIESRASETLRGHTLKEVTKPERSLPYIDYGTRRNEYGNEYD